jgi:hypothetical protein
MQLIQWNLSYETSDSAMEVSYPSVVCALPAANSPSLHSAGLHVSPFFERVSSACQGLVLRATWLPWHLDVRVSLASNSLMHFLDE